MALADLTICESTKQNFCIMDEKETYWEVTQTAVIPRFMTKAEIREMKSQSSWLNFHVYKDSFGVECLIFENRSRAELCFYERANRNIQQLKLS